MTNHRLRIMSTAFVRLLQVLCVMAFADSWACADGKFFAPRDLPTPGEPFQRALIVHEDATEFLLVQPSAVGDVKDFAWVLPVPSVPALGTVDTDFANGLFRRLEWRSKPVVVELSELLWFLVFGTLLVLAVITAVLAIARKSKKRGLQACGCILILLLMTFTLVRSSSLGVDGVNVLASAKVGVYDTTIVRASDPGGLRRWLVERGYSHGEEDEAVFDSYIDRGWSFVAVRVSNDSTEGELGTLDGLLPPLVLLFESTEPVYPYALTATASHPVEVVLYVAAKQRVQCSALETEFSGRGGWYNDLGGFWEEFVQLLPMRYP